MSRTTIHIWRDESGERVREYELSNSWGSGARVWSILQRHLDLDPDNYPYAKGPGMWPPGFTLLTDEDQGELWALYKSEDVPVEERIALAMTFDRVWISKEEMPVVAVALREVRRWHPPRKIVCHLDAIADVLDEESVADDCFGVSFQQTSVSDDPWWEYDPEDDEDGGHPVGAAGGHSISDVVPGFLDYAATYRNLDPEG